MSILRLLHTGTYRDFLSNAITQKISVRLWLPYLSYLKWWRRTLRWYDIYPHIFLPPPCDGRLCRHKNLFARWHRSKIVSATVWRRTCIVPYHIDSQSPVHLDSTRHSPVPRRAINCCGRRYGCSRCNSIDRTRRLWATLQLLVAVDRLMRRHNNHRYRLNFHTNYWDSVNELQTLCGRLGFMRI